MLLVRVRAKIFAGHVMRRDRPPSRVCAALADATILRARPSSYMVEPVFSRWIVNRNGHAVNDY